MKIYTEQQAMEPLVAFSLMMISMTHRHILFRLIKKDYTILLF